MVIYCISQQLSIWKGHDVIVRLSLLQQYLFPIFDIYEFYKIRIFLLIMALRVRVKTNRLSDELKSDIRLSMPGMPAGWIKTS